MSFLVGCSFFKSTNEMEHLEGKYVLLEGKSVYDSFSFKGQSTVVIESMGMEFVTSYIKDESYLRLDAQPSNILLKVKSEIEIQGEGFASGIYIKEALLKQYQDSLSKQKDILQGNISNIVPEDKIEKSEVVQRTMVKKDVTLQSDVLKESTRKEKTEKKRLADEQRKKEQAISNKVAGAFGMGSAEGNSQGDAATGTGNQGSPFGNSDHGAKGVGGYGSLNLNGRSIGSVGLPRPACTIQEEGRIVINITVDPKGNVVFTEIYGDTNIDNASMRKSALEAARRAKFNSITGANNQSGTITYLYKFK